jgi:heme A synthase
MILNLSNLNDTQDPYSRDPIVECSILTHIGIYCVILLILSIILNIILIWILIKHRKQLLDSANVLILILSILNFLGSITELPLVGTAAFMCK